VRARLIVRFNRAGPLPVHGAGVGTLPRRGIRATPPAVLVCEYALKGVGNHLQAYYREDHEGVR